MREATTKLKKAVGPDNTQAEIIKLRDDSSMKRLTLLTKSTRQNLSQYRTRETLKNVGTTELLA